MGWRRWGKYKKTRGIPKIEEPTIWDHMLSHEKSFIYIMSSEANKDLLKIGKTERTPEERAKELSGSTSTPFPFRVEHYYCIPKELLNQTELNIHRQLKKVGKHASKEFFRLSIEEAKADIEDILKRMGILDIALGKLNEFNSRVTAHNFEEQEKRKLKTQQRKDKEKLDAQNQFREECSANIESLINNTIFSSLKSAKVLKLIFKLLASPSRLMAPIWNFLGDTLPFVVLTLLYFSSPFLIVWGQGFNSLSSISAYIRDYIYAEPLRQYLMAPPFFQICFVSWGYVIWILRKVLTSETREIKEENFNFYFYQTIPFFIFAYASNIGFIKWLVIAPVFILLYTISIFGHLFLFYRPTSEYIENAIIDAYKAYVSSQTNRETLGIKSSDIQVVIRAIEDGRTDLDRLKKGEIELYFPVLKNKPSP